MLRAHATSSTCHQFTRCPLRRLQTLCSPDLTAIEPESNGQVVTGLDFHRFYFDAAAAAAASGETKPKSKVGVAWETIGSAFLPAASDACSDAV